MLNINPIKEKPNKLIHVGIYFFKKNINIHGLQQWPMSLHQHETLNSNIHILQKKQEERNIKKFGYEPC